MCSPNGEKLSNIWPRSCAVMATRLSSKNVSRFLAVMGCHELSKSAYS
jgi:hypothetical protein